MSELYMSLKLMLEETLLIKSDTDNSLQQKIKVEQKFAVTVAVFRHASAVTFIFMRTKPLGIHCNIYISKNTLKSTFDFDTM